jgi:hypothetical protein
MPGGYNMSKGDRQMKRIRYGMAAAVSAAALTASGGTAFAEGVAPNVDQAADPGEVIHLTKTVSTPPIPPKPDIVLLVDKTGSMGGELANVKANFSSIVSQVKAVQPDARFAVAAYCDFGDPAPAFQLFTDLIGDPGALTTAINNVNLCSGGDTPEAQLNALWEIGNGGDAVTFRPDSSRIVVWYGDNPGHDPSGGHTEADATQSLVDVDAKVLALSTGSSNNLDGTGQAARITSATGGNLLSGVAAGGVSDAILAGLQNLDVTVAGSPTCDPGLSISLSPASRTVQSGTDAEFDETITVAPGAPQGATLQCTVPFTLNGADAGSPFTQTVSIDVNDVTPPSVSCPPGPNPAGNEPQATNEDGFFRMVASDNVDASVPVSIKDLGSGTVFGPYPSGTTFKLTQAPGAPVKAKVFTGEVKWKFTFNGDAQLIATDAAGNTATATCLVPPND